MGAPTQVVVTQESEPGGPGGPLEHPVPKEEEVDHLFRAQVKVQDFLLGYWRHGVAMVGVGLVGVLVWSLWHSRVERVQLAATRAMSAVDSKVAALDPMGAGVPVLATEKDEELARRAAERYEEIAGDGTRAAAAEAWLKAADLWLALGESERAMTAYQAAARAYKKGVFGAAAWNGVAVLALASDDVDGAVEAWRKVGELEGALAEQGLASAAKALKERGDARAEEFLLALQARFPASEHLAELGASPAQAPPEG